ncbi:MAG TPA: vitamin K epoxide reductase family protein, partial [Thermomicrobiales bacterium]|nr:vitamin K epoxide reductase family protein [Thermomicrobiales bacterium]
LDADAVDAAPEAYAILATPDAALGLASYGATTVLAAMAGPDRATTRPIIPLLMAVKILVDALIGAKLTVDQWTKHRAFCFWCLLGALASVISVPLATLETRAALRSVRKVPQ